MRPGNGTSELIDVTIGTGCGSTSSIIGAVTGPGAGGPIRLGNGDAPGFGRFPFDATMPGVPRRRSPNARPAGTSSFEPTNFPAANTAGPATTAPAISAAGTASFLSSFPGRALRIHFGGLSENPRPSSPSMSHDSQLPRCG